MRMLRTAKLRALPAIDAGSIGLKPLFVGLAWNRLGLAGQPGYPERVDNIGAFQLEPHGFTGGNMDLVGGDEMRRCVGRVVVSDFPPPVVSGHRDRQRRGFGGRSDLIEREQRIDQHGDEHGYGEAYADHDPAQAAHAMSELMQGDVRTPPQDSGAQQAADNYAD